MTEVGMSQRTPEQLRRHREWQAGYRARNRAVINQKQRAYCKRPEVKVQRRIYYRLRSIQMLLVEARKRAKKKNIAFALVESDIKVPEFCPVLGIPLKFGGDRPNWPSLDRRDNSLGYVPGNVFVISHRANNLKSSATIDEVRQILRYMQAAP